LALILASASPTGGGGASATLVCPRVSEPGRVRCEVEVKPPSGATLKWADMLVVSTPPFAVPLRARVGPAEATTHEETVWHWTIALAARARGTGEIEARVRVVTCVRDACTPSEITARALLAVGD
jgi:hypothetical protein